MVSVLKRDSRPKSPGLYLRFSRSPGRSGPTSGTGRQRAGPPSCAARAARHHDLGHCRAAKGTEEIAEMKNLNVPIATEMVPSNAELLEMNNVHGRN